jgi:hypothetical protein
MFKALLNRLRRPSETKMLIGTIGYQQQVLERHLIALARLSFIKPDRLVEEANNLEANAEYLHKMIKSKEDKKIVTN